MAHRMIQQAMGFATGFGKRVVSTASAAPAIGRMAWGTASSRGAAASTAFRQARGAGVGSARIANRMMRGAMPNLYRNMAIGAGVGAVGNMAMYGINNGGFGTMGGYMRAGLGGGMMGAGAVGGFMGGGLMTRRSQAGRFRSGINVGRGLAGLPNM